MFYYHKNMLSNIFANFFLATCRNKMTMRNNSQIISIYCSSNVSKQTIKFWGPKIWNQITLKIKNTKISHSFISKLMPDLNKNQIKL